MNKLIPVFALLSLAACGNPAKKACNNAADCAEEAGLGEVDVDACVADAETGEADADELGCGGEYKDYQKCAAGAECDAETGILTGCDAELTALFECAVEGATTGS